MEDEKILDAVYEHEGEWTDQQIGEFVRRALTEDICEWYCERCGAAGINHVIYTYALFYPDDEVHNFIEALRGHLK